MRYHKSDYFIIRTNWSFWQHLRENNTYILSSSDSLPDKVLSKRAAASDNWTLSSSSNTPRTSPCVYRVGRAKGKQTKALEDRMNRHYACETVFWTASFNMLTLATYFSVVQASLGRGKWPAFVGTNRCLRRPPQKKHCHLFCTHTVQQMAHRIYTKLLEVAHACAKLTATQPVSRLFFTSLVGRRHLSPSCGPIQFQHE